MSTVIDLEKVNRVHMLRVAPRLLGETVLAVSCWDNGAIAHRLTQSFASEGELLQCLDCRGQSPATLAECPFCGTRDDLEVGDHMRERASTRNVVEQAKALVVRGEGEEEDMTTTTNGSNGAMVKQAQPLTKVIRKKKEPVVSVVDREVSELDTAVAEVHRLNGKTAASIWEMGTYLLKEIYEPQLWKTRKQENGKDAHKSFDAFVKAEVKLSTNYVFRSMEVAKCFPIEIAQQIGRSHLKLLVGAPKEDHAELIKQIKEEGIDARSLYEEIKKRRKARGVTRQTIVGKKETKGGKGRPKSVERISLAKDADTIAIILPNKRQTLKLMCRPAKKGEEVKQAKSLDDEPQLELEGANGVKLFVRVKQAVGGLTLVVEPRREEKEEE